MGRNSKFCCKRKKDHGRSSSEAFDASFDDSTATVAPRGLERLLMICFYYRRCMKNVVIKGSIWFKVKLMKYCHGVDVEQFEHVAMHKWWRWWCVDDLEFGGAFGMFCVQLPVMPRCSLLFVSRTLFILTSSYLFDSIMPMEREIRPNKWSKYKEYEQTSIVEFSSSCQYYHVVILYICSLELLIL